MKKFLYTLLALTLALGCTACSKKEMTEEPKDIKQAINTAMVNNSENELIIKLNDETEIALTKIEKGSFKMGSAEGFGDEDELPVREITLTKDFYMGTYEITQQQWEAVMGSNPSNFKGESLPVETVTWEESMEFCKKLSEQTGLKVSLPTEAQWEYACRAGSEAKWFFGEDESLYEKYANINTEDTTIAVGSFEPNPNGLYDMYGNVMEWCLDYYSPQYDKADITDPTGSTEGDARISRGGGWGASPNDCRSAYRNACGENEATDGIGLRIVVNS